MAEAEVSEFLTYLADDKNVAASTQNQALNALLFLYKEVLKQQIGWIDQVDRVRKPKKMPVVLSRDEVKRIFAHLNGVSKLMAAWALTGTNIVARPATVRAMNDLFRSFIVECLS